MKSEIIWIAEYTSTAKFVEKFGFSLTMTRQFKSENEARQTYLTRFLESVKHELRKKSPFEMPLKTLYISYILTNLGNSLKDEYYREEDKCNFEIAQKYQREVTVMFHFKYKNHHDMLKCVTVTQKRGLCG